MKTRLFIYTILLISIINSSFADGIMLSSNKSYTNNLLKNVGTEINVEINGLVAITTVFQEFLNESDSMTDAVWSFPMPEGARSMRLRYWYNDTAFDARLMVVQQSTNPGTGEGGIAAVINNYIGKNGIKILLKNIRPHDVQAVELKYIELLNYDNANYSYSYPLETKDLISFPIDYLKINIDLNCKTSIIHYDAKSFNSALIQVENDSDFHMRFEMLKPKAYLSKDLEFEFTTVNKFFDYYMYSSMSDSADGYFNLFLVNQDFAEGQPYMNSKIVFLIGNSSTMAGYKLQQSLIAVKKALDMLSPSDSFNIILFNSNVDSWRDSLLIASTANISSAKAYLDNVTAVYGNRLELGLAEALGQFKNNSNSNTIFAFTDGKSALDPYLVKTANLFDVAIIIAAIGNDVDRYRLEMTTSLNYGFVRYFNVDDDINMGLSSVFLSISHPIYKNVHIDFNKADVTDVGPIPLPTAFVGTHFYACGRYSIPDTSTCKMTCEGIYGKGTFPFLLTYNGFDEQGEFAKNMWAKLKMDDLERQIMIYGEDTVLKKELIALSLKYKMKCRYTAYIATYEYDPGGGPWLTISDPGNNDLSEEASKIQNCYPNPFSAFIIVTVNISKQDLNKTKLLKIYNSAGMLVHIIDLSKYLEGTYNVRISTDKFRSKLARGYNIIVLQLGNEIVSQGKVLFIPE